MQNLTDHEKFMLLTKHFDHHIATNFLLVLSAVVIVTFRIAGYNGLVHSESDNGGFCKNCVLFARAEPRKELGVLVNRPLIDYKRATQKLTDHFQGKKFHKAAIEAAEAFTATMKNQDLAINRFPSSKKESVLLRTFSNMHPLLKLYFFVDGRG